MTRRCLVVNGVMMVSTRMVTDSTGDPRPQVVGGGMLGNVTARPRDLSWGLREVSLKGRPDQLIGTVMAFVVTVVDGAAEVVAIAQGSSMLSSIRHRLV